MEQITISLPDSVEMSEQEIQALVLDKIYQPTSDADIVKLASRPMPVEYVAEIRHLVVLYFAERASRLMDFQESTNWSGETMQEWLQQHMREGL